MNLSLRGVLLILISTVGAFAQSTNTAEKKVYTTTSGEIILSWANINYQGFEEPSIIRFSPVFNFQNWVNIDKSDNFGYFTGLSVRNVGFIYDVPNTTNRMKHRTYNFGIPFGIKIGDLSERFIFVGYELEIPFNYRETTRVDGNKTATKDIWFSNRVNTFNHTLMAGVQLPYGATLKFKYYLTNFFNRDFEESDGQGGTTKPYADSDFNIFYFSLNFGLLRNSKFYYDNK